MSSNSTCINTCNKKSDSRSAVDRFCLSHVKLQTELNSTQSYHQFSIFFYPKNHLHGVKSRQSQSEVVLSKSAKESTRRLYSKPKTVLYILSREIDLLILTCVPELVFFVRNWGILVDRLSGQAPLWRKRKAIKSFNLHRKCLNYVYFLHCPFWFFCSLTLPNKSLTLLIYRFCFQNII